MVWEILCATKNMTLKDAGRIFNAGYDHTTVMWAIDELPNILSQMPTYAKIYNAICTEMKVDKSAIKMYREKRAFNAKERNVKVNSKHFATR